jgi:hypothetical protein
MEEGEAGGAGRRPHILAYMRQDRFTNAFEPGVA